MDEVTNEALGNSRLVSLQHTSLPHLTLQFNVKLNNYSKFTNEIVSENVH